MDTPHEIDDAAAEALLAGRGVAPDLEPLARVVAAYRQAACRPVPPRGELAAQMVTGAFGRPGRYRASARAGQAREPTVAGHRPRRGRRVTGRLGRIATRLVGASLAVKAGAGVAIALASVGTGGAAGVLPDVVQHRFDSVVRSVSGDETPSPIPAPPRPTDPPTTPTPANEDAEFGQDVSEDAQDGGVDGGQLDERAREQGQERRPDEPPAPAPVESAGPPGGPADRGRPADPGKPTERPTPPRDRTGDSNRPGPPPDQ